MMFRNITITVLLMALVVAGRVEAADLTVGSLTVMQGETATVVVSGSVNGESTFGVNILVEIVTRVGNTGTLQFTATPPVDVVQIGDPWPGVGTFSAYDSDMTGSAVLNGSVDDDGAYVPASVIFSGELTGFPVTSSVSAEGIWDILLSTSAGDSSWEGLATTLAAGTITVIAGECVTGADCDDGVNCTDNTCVDATCVYVANDANCTGDGLFCNGMEVCDPVLDCVSPGDPCLPGEFCNETTDTCDECQVGGDCDDGVGCTDDTCVDGSCVFTANNANCTGDGLFCTGTEVCDPVLDCVSPGDPCLPGEFCNETTDTCDECQVGDDCDDGVGCTDDACVAGSCEFTANDAYCPDDGLYCNGTEFCDPALDCTSTGNPCTPQVCDEGTDTCTGCTVDAECDDGNPCTDDACVDTLCEYTNNTAPCDDGLFCTGSEGCVDGECISSGDPCTAPLLCSEALDACVQCLINTDCDDADVCTDDVCDVGGVCDNTYNTATCDDGLFCTLTDVCSSGECLGSGDSCPGQACDEAIDACVDASASLSVENLYMDVGETANVVVSGQIAGFDTFGVTIYVEIAPRAGNIGTVVFTTVPPTDIVQIDDAWPGTGTFTPYDTDWTGSSFLNGAIDDNGTFVPSALVFTGSLAGFPVVSSAEAGGVWDVVLSTSVGDSNWEGVPTTLIAGTITVAPNVSLSANSFAMPPNATVDVVVWGEVEDQSTYGMTILVELVPRVGATGMLTFTPAPPADIYQIGDPWPGAGSHTDYDTDATASTLLNGYVDDNGSFLPGPLTFAGDLAGFPVTADSSADGVWDVMLSTSVGVSSWEGLTTVLGNGVITVTPGACVLDTDCDDANPCTTDVCNAGICEYTVVVGSCDDGDLCTVNDTCVADVCLGTPMDCSGLDDTCNVGTCNPASGVCEAIPINEGGTCNDGDLCTQDDACVVGVCTGTPVDCSALDDACNVGACNPATGACEGSPTNEGGPCEDGNLCTENDVCTNGSCSGTPRDCTYLTDACNMGVCNSMDGSCTTLFINQGGPCDDDIACTRGDKCTDGVCAGTPLDCSGLTDACNNGACNPATGLCEAVPTNEGGVCDDDDPCTENDACASGVCAGTAIPGCQNCDIDPDCDDGNVCTQNVCVGGVCVDTDLTDPCDDGDLCTIGDVCSAGICTGTPLDCSGLDDDCNIGVCNAFTGTCMAEPANEGGPCNDGLPCTVNDECTEGVCRGTLVDSPSVNLAWSPAMQTVQVGETVLIDLIASSGTCIDQPVGGIDAILNWNPARLFLEGKIRPVPNLWLISYFPDDSGLDGLNAPFGDVPGNDGDALYQALRNFQTGVNIPPAGTVVVTFEFTALDGTVGTQVVIPPTVGSFTQTRVLGAGADLGVDITGTLGRATVRITECEYATECDDADVCTDDACSAGVCEYTDNTAPCDDGLFCTVIDVCSGGACVGSSDPCSPPLLCSEDLDACVQCLTAVDCYDGNLCTDDICNAVGACENPNNTVPCDDGRFCTPTDVCSGGACIGLGDACPGEVCDEANDRCVECLIDGDCDDANVCTDEVCSANVCDYTNNTLSCDDELFCTATDTCVDAECKGSGNPCDASLVCSESLDACVECELDGQCDDGNLCTTDICVLNTCTNNANLLPCDDGLFCTATDTCSVAVCVGIGDTCPGQLCDEVNDICVDCFILGDCPNDGVGCTVDACVDGACVYPPDDALCDDGLWCNGPEFCHTLMDCQPGESPCDDPNLCNEIDHTCGCQEPVIVGEGCRYLAVTPRTGETPVALLVTGVDQSVACVSLYVQTDGRLGQMPVYKPPRGATGWGTAHVRGFEILPDTTYTVQAECDTGLEIGLSTPATAKTWMWADTDNTGGLVNILDITWIVDGFRGIFDMATLYAVDIWGGSMEECRPQLVIDILDMSLAVDAFRQFPYPCDAVPCP